jgi:glutamate 5-kinase
MLRLADFLFLGLAMKRSLKYRESIREARRVVVKVGTRVLVRKNGRPDPRRFRSLVRDVADLRQRGIEVVIVTSGAVGTGMAALGMQTRPTTLPDLQMAAAVGQSRLMALYDKLFTARQCKVGQVLLTHGDFYHKIRYLNASRTMNNLLRHGVIPIVNENDVVADEELIADVKKLGDNDLLAALVVKMIRADLLVILSTVDGLRAPAGNGRTRRVRYLEAITRRTFELVTAHRSPISSGGMATKLKAAREVARAGSNVVIANGCKAGNLIRVMNGADIGTFVVASVAT